MANPEHVKVVRQGAAAIAEWRRQNPEASLDLRGGRAHLRPPSRRRPQQGQPPRGRPPRDDIWTDPGFRVVRAGRDLTPWLRDRNYADFSDESRYEDSLQHLLKALRRKAE